MTQMINRILKSIPIVISIISLVIIIIFSSFLVGLVGYLYGYRNGNDDTTRRFEEILAKYDIYVSSIADSDEDPEVIKEYVYITPQPRQIPNWSGPELFDAVNQRRVELGVNPLANNTELCTIASLRLNELLKLGELDAHEGFIALSKREDYQHIFQKYNVFEFLLSGAQSAQEAVSLWENTQGHSKLLTGGEYVWGCTYAQNGFGVAITAF